jgi:hypothetical protein
MQHRSKFSLQVLFITHFTPYVLLAAALSLSVAVRVEGGGQGNAGVVVVGL